MIKKLILALMIFSLPLAAAAEKGDYKKYVGEWVGPDGVFLIVKEKGEFIKLESPTNPEWRAEYKNVRIQDDRLKFEELNFMSENGKGFTFNGIVNYVEMWEDNDGVMNVTVRNDMDDQVVSGAIARTDD